MKRISLERLPEFFSALSEKNPLYLPVKSENGAFFRRWEKGCEAELKENTVRSAKDFFFPQTENFARFFIDGKKIEVQEVRLPDEPFILFGVRACDVKSFDVLDRVFLQEPVDTFYRARRENAVIISLACREPEETCFCQAFGIDAAEPGGDIAAWEKDGFLYLDAKTEKGKALLEKEGLENADGTEAESAKEDIRAILKKLPLQNLPLDAFQPEKLMEFFSDPRWKELSHSCIGCGTCTFVCPTCQCFDIRDFDTGHGVQRFRCWDSCMYRDFSQMAAANPRLTQLERFRQRFMHKLIYYPANNDGLFMCVGCGRCLKKCPVHMNIVKVIKTLGGEKNAD